MSGKEKGEKGGRVEKEYHVSELIYMLIYIMASALPTRPFLLYIICIVNVQLTDVVVSIINEPFLIL